nr:hypothetical protein [uncultured Sphingosinicella sp.]
MVLVVDDEPMVRMFAVDLFEEMGCEVIEAGSGPEALAALEHRPDISLMFAGRWFGSPMINARSSA